MSQSTVVIPPPPEPTQLIVFADDWGRHPSSSQHLIKQLLPQYPTLWVNTIGTRKLRLCMTDLKRGVQKLWKVASASDARIDTLDLSLPENLYVIEPMMYPGFRSGWQRRFNKRKLSKAIHGCFGETLTTTPLFVRHKPDRLHRVAITTLPITADLVGALHVDRWVYSCVDDYSQWPGTDHAVMDAMERELVSKVDAVACVSETLRDRVSAMGRGDSSLLTHGVEMAMWQSPALDSCIAASWPDTSKPIALFWGLIDDRLDRAWCDCLCSHGLCELVLAGPRQDGDEWVIGARPPYNWIGPVQHADLPAHAASAQVLVMPYIDAPVTRAMQPLKLLEYLATMRPVVVRDLPSTREWADCCDLASDAHSFAELVAERAKTGTPPDQLSARKQRLPDESWSAKAAQLASIING